MGSIQRREWLEKLDEHYNPLEHKFQAGVVQLSGFIRDQFYYDYRYPEVELPHLLAEHFRNKVDMFVWYSWAEGLQYEFDHITLPAASPAQSTSSYAASFDPLDVERAFAQVRIEQQTETGRRGGGKYANNASDAMREIHEHLTGYPDKHIVALFQDVMWQFPGSNPADQNLVPLVRTWPNVCLGRHLVIFAAEVMPDWVQNFLKGTGSIGLTIAGPTADEIKQRLIYEHLRSQENFFDWAILDSVANYFETAMARPDRGYRFFVTQNITHRGGAYYDAEFLKINQAEAIAVDYQRIDVQAFEQYLNDHIIGQSEAKRWAVTEVKRLQQRANRQQRPKPVPRIRKLFAGPSGVGKTEIARVMCKFIFDREPLIISGVEYQMEHEVVKLLGAPPGYVGYGQPGILTRYLQERPYGLILLDEYEKGHDSLRLFFMNALEEGYATTPDGTRLSFGETVVIATSNAGAQEADEHAKADQVSATARKQIYDEAISRAYNQALLGRFGGYIVFDRFTEEERWQIAQLYIRLFIRQTQREYNLPVLEFDATNNFYQQLLQRCPRNLGARKIKDAVTQIMELVVDYYLEGKAQEASRVVQLDWTGPFPSVNEREIEVHL
ncbi:MAG TPA: AAA family ATPase [Anaerolineae bacterium]|nr:AAA family ATPase [Anaerolineae bacterium]